MKKYRNYIDLIIGCFLLAFSFQIFLEPNEFVTSGVSGISIIISHFFSLDESLFILITSLFLLIISYFTLGKKKTINSILGSLLFPFFIKIISLITSYLALDVTNLLLASIFGGLLNGIGLGLIYKAGFNTGGTDIICEIFKKYLKVTTGTGIFLTEFLIVITGGIVFGFEKFLYALLILLLSSKLSDRVILGISSNKSFYIITKEEDKVLDFILHDLGYGVTILESYGSYRNQKQSILMSVIKTSQYTRLKEGIKKIDKAAIFFVSDAYEVLGGVK